jgi:hypothetical protein
MMSPRCPRSASTPRRSHIEAGAQEPDMLDAAYDSEAIRVISDALAGALLELEGMAQRRFADAEKAGFSTRIAHDLLEAYDSGERSPEMLNRIALPAIKYPMARWRGYGKPDSKH